MPTTTTDRPRIAMICIHGYVAASPPYGAADTGGLIDYVLELSRKLAQLGHLVDIWTRRFEDQPEIELVADDVRIIRIPCGGTDFIAKEYLHRYMAEWVGSALRYAYSHKLAYDFVNSHYWDAGVAGEAMAAALNVPHVFTPHSLGIWKRQQMELDFPGDVNVVEANYSIDDRTSYERAVMAGSCLVIATTPAQLDLLAKDYQVSVDRIEMVPPGYDDNRFFPISAGSRQAIRRRLGFNGKVILALGRLAPNKGYDLLIRAFAVVASRIHDAVLHLAIGGGEGNVSERQQLADLKALARSLRIEDCVQFRGCIDDSDLADHYRAADVFVLSSRYESFGMTAVEAMACGTPTVLTIHGGIWPAMTFGRNALFADPYDPVDLGITMLKPLRLERLRNRLSHMGSSRVRELFTWSGIATKLVTAVSRGKVATPVGLDAWGQPLVP